LSSFGIISGDCLTRKALSVPLWGVNQKDGSWGVHAPSYALKKVDEARLLTDGAKAALAGKNNTVALKK